MAQGRKGIKRRILLYGLLLVAVFFVSSFVVLRTDYVSNRLKENFLSEFKEFTGYTLDVKKIIINPLPLYLEAKDVKVLGQGGQSPVLQTGRLKLYVSPVEVLFKKLVIPRVSLTSPEVFLTDENIDELKKLLGKTRSDTTREATRGWRYETNIRAIEFHDASVRAALDSESIGITLEKGDIRAVLSGVFELSLNSANLSVFPLNKPEEIISGTLRGRMIFQDKGVTVDNMHFVTGREGLDVEAGGVWNWAGFGRFDVKSVINEAYVVKRFDLKKNSGGRLLAEGRVEVDPPVEHLTEPEGKEPSISSRPGLAGRTRLDLALKGGFLLESLVKPLGVDSRLEGALEGEGTLKGPLLNLIGEGPAVLNKGNLFDIDVDEVRANVRYSGGPDGALEFTEGDISLYGGAATGEVRLSMPRVNEYTIDLEFLGVPSKEVFRLIRFDPLLSPGRVDGTVYSSGEEFEPSGWFYYSAEVEGQNVLEKVLSASGKYRMKDNVVFLNECTGDTTVSSASWSGSVDLVSEALSFEASLETGDIGELSAPYFEKIGGHAVVNATVGGTFHNPKITGRAKAESARLGTYELGGLLTEFTYTPKLLALKSFQSESALVEGEIGFPTANWLFDLLQPRLNLRMKLSGAPVESLAGIFYGPGVQASGVADVTVSLSEDPQNNVTKFDVKGNVENGRLYGIGYKAINAESVFDKKHLRLHKSTFTLVEGSELKLSGMLARDGSYEFSASSGNVGLKELLVSDTVPFECEGSFEARGSGNISSPEAEATGRLFQCRRAGYEVEGGRFDISLLEGEVLFKTSLMAGRGQVTGRAELNDKMPFTARLTLAHGRYDRVLGPIFGMLPDDGLLTLQAWANISGDVSGIEADATINRLNLSLYGSHFTNNGEIEITYKKGAVGFDRFALRSGATEFSLSGGLVPGVSYDMRLRGASSFVPLKMLLKQFELMRGRADYDLKIRGAWDKPLVTGRLDVQKGSFILRGINHHLGEVNASVRFYGDRAVVESLNGELGGGGVEMSGVIFLDGLKPGKYHFESVLTSVTAVTRANLQAILDGRLVLTGGPEGRSLAGELVLNRSYYGEDIDWRRLILRAGDETYSGQEPEAFSDTELNVRLYSREPVEIDNNLARASLRVDLALRGTLQKPRVFGRVSSSSGELYFRNNRFEILNATMDFADPIRLNPMVDVAATTTVKGYDIRLVLKGQLDGFDLALSSEPALTDVEILSLLTVGRLGSDVEGIEGDIGAAEATAFLAGEVQQELQRKLSDITGFDRIRIDPYVSSETGDVSPRVTVSKKLIGEKIFLTYSTVLGQDEEEDFLQVEYQLRRNVTLVGERDEDGALGGDVRLRFDFR